ncbi:hypothetical protein H2201_002359 [Coniosporium apollinis]|uniref:Ubiquitin-like domain-containing protein n=1 Tax=Coniosporium apollinis TaxID=61459 RepID=A0ABQ9NYQ4_9PEZI|nr:hypothetical protein H2201_002359 [Coniosporium apollinis]
MAAPASASLSAPAQQIAERATSDEPTTSVELNTLSPHQPSSTEPATTSSLPPTTSATPAAPTPPPADTAPAPAPASPTSRPHAAPRAETEAIGPSTDTPTPAADPSGGPAVIITLLVTAGTKHPYRVDAKYLRKRGVEVEGMDPFNVSVYQLKELILRDWREEWEPRPSSPNAIRLIHFGRYLEDNAYLKDCRFNPSSPNVVHMTVKPPELADDEDAHASKAQKGSRTRSDRGDDERTAGYDAEEAPPLLDVYIPSGRLGWLPAVLRRWESEENEGVAAAS